jgi:hypothetical protein
MYDWGIWTKEHRESGGEERLRTISISGDLGCSGYSIV